MAIHRLKAIFVDKVTRAGMYADGAGLYLQVGKGGGAKSWIFRYSRVRFGRPGEAHMGLGPKHTISPHDAREMARECRRQLLQGLDPMETRKSVRVAKQLDAAKQVTFACCAEEYCDYKLKTWAPSTAKTAARAIHVYLYPKLERMPISAITSLHVEEVIKPLWEKKTPTAMLVRMHLEAILDRAKAKGFRTGDNPASLKGPLGVLLPDSQQVHIIRHHASLPYQEIGAFMRSLRAYKSRRLSNGKSVFAALLQFIILTAVRVSEAREMCWSEIDWNTKLWTCPWQRTKTGKKTWKDHFVPLSNPALAILKGMQVIQSEDGIESNFVFLHAEPRDKREQARRIAQGGRQLTGKVVSHGGIIFFLQKRMGRKDLTVHGFRSTFSSWANDTGFQREDIEMALDHLVGNRVERIYARDAQRLESRKRLMHAWGEYCERAEPFDAKVIPMRSGN
jgi:integrase